MMLHNKKRITSILFVLIGMVCLAQGTDPPPPSTPPPGLPIDSGVLMGVCIALIYGAKKLLKSN